MSAPELRSSFHELIDKFSDTEKMQMFYDAMKDAVKQEHQKDILDDLDADQKQELQEGLEQSYSGKTISHDEAMKKIEQWRIK